jgi:hypothetical protein
MECHRTNSNLNLDFSSFKYESLIAIKQKQTFLSCFKQTVKQTRELQAEDRPFSEIF